MTTRGAPTSRLLRHHTIYLTSCFMKGHAMFCHSASSMDLTTWTNQSLQFLQALQALPFNPFLPTPSTLNCVGVIKITCDKMQARTCVNFTSGTTTSTSTLHHLTPPASFTTSSHITAMAATLRRDRDGARASSRPSHTVQHATVASPKLGLFPSPKLQSVHSATLC